MNNKNNKILQEVKDYIKSSNIEKKNLTDKDLNQSLISDKIDSLDSIIKKEIKNWIKNNATEISKDIISVSVKKLFK
tara:strand:+ start:378 stop:608 length:231 start_codon:yes stop_codon:yes gene_type:complete